MNIFDYEREDGVGELILAQDKLSIASQLILSEEKTESLIERLQGLLGSKASIEDEDLFYIEYILCSTSKNLNDDVFDPVEVWHSRSTCTHKPINLQHNAKDIIGHCISSFGAEAESGDRIKEDISIDQLPNKYHLVASGVLYKKLPDKELQTRASELISKIQDGKLYISMECWFSSFSHMLESASGEVKFLPRSRENLRYTKALRAYGGSGDIDGCKISRVLRNILFTGAGLVTKPANPESVITFSRGMLDFKTDSTKSIENDAESEKNGVLNSLGDNFNNKGVVMANENTDKFEKEITELKAALKIAQDQLVEAGKAKYEEKIVELTEQVKAFEAKETEHKIQIDKMATQVSEASAKVEEANKSKAAAEERLTKIEAESVKANRISELVSAGVDKAEATKTVDQFAFLNDEQFKSVAELAVAAAKVAKKDEKKDKKEKKDDEAYASDDNADNADETLIEKAKAAKSEDVDLSADKSDEKEVARAALAERMNKLMSHKRVVVSK